jgi:3-hydroxybutyryl-CoA dehydrogenase
MEKLQIGVIGSGAMGSGIAQVAAQAGHKVVVYDTKKEALDRALASLKKTLGSLVEKKKITHEESSSIENNISHVTDLKEFGKCGFIIEAVVEDLGVKKKLFSDLEKIVVRNTILATNTSSLSVTSIASACEHPERVVGVHFFNPAPIMPLVEIIPGVATTNEYLNNAKQLIDSWKKVTVLAKDTPGFIVNRVARPFYGEAIRIYEEGIADRATIDWAMKTVGGFRMGPFELMDFIGNDINYKVTETVWEQFFYDPRFKPSLTQKRLYEAGFFGRKSGRGHYQYTDGVQQSTPVENELLAKQIFERIIAMLVSEAADALYMNVASAKDLETSMTKGVNYPKGLLAWANEIGLKHILDTLINLQDMYGEDRYRPCVLLKRMVLKGETFAV